RPPARFSAAPPCAPSLPTPPPRRGVGASRSQVFCVLAPQRRAGLDSRRPSRRGRPSRLPTRAVARRAPDPLLAIFPGSRERERRLSDRRVVGHRLGISALSTSLSGEATEPAVSRHATAP